MVLLSALDAIFPKVNGDLFPPPNYLSTGAKIREWRSFTKANQQREIEQCAEEERRQAVTASRDRERLERRRNREQTSSNSAPLSHDTAHIDQLATESITPVGDTVQQSNLDSSTSVQDPTPFATDDENASQAHDNVSVEDKVSKTCKITSAADIVDELDDNDDTNKSVTFNIPTPTTSASPANRPTTTLKEPPPTKHKRNLNDDLDLDNCCSDCKGITSQIILKSNCKDKSDILQGFHHLVGNAYRLKGSEISNNGEWNYEDNTVGFLLDHNNKLDGYSSFTWKCAETGTNKWHFHRSNCDNSTSMHAE